MYDPTNLKEINTPIIQKPKICIEKIIIEESQKTRIIFGLIEISSSIFYKVTSLPSNLEVDRTYDDFRTFREGILNLYPYLIISSLPNLNQIKIKDASEKYSLQREYIIVISIEFFRSNNKKI